MEALRFIETIEKDTLTIKNLKKFKGNQVEIIIIPIDNQKLEYEEEWAVEAEKRLNEIKKGKVKTIPADVVFEKLEKSRKKIR